MRGLALRISTYLALVFVCPALPSCTAYYSSAEDRGVDVEPEALPDEGGDTVRDVEGEENPFSNVDPVWEWTPYEEQLEGYAPIPAGRFTMGCSPGDTMCCLTDCWWPFSIEKPHEVIITRDFWMKETEVTQGEWEALTGYNNTIYTGCGPDCPQDNISWWEMAAFCNLHGMVTTAHATSRTARAYTSVSGRSARKSNSIRRSR